MRLIDADALCERASNLEAQALSYVGKIINDEAKKEEWHIWSAILTERTAFKHDVFDAPTVNAIPIEWLYEYTRKNPLYQSDDFDIYVQDMIWTWETGETE